MLSKEQRGQIGQLEKLMRQDPGRRGLLSSVKAGSAAKAGAASKAAAGVKPRDRYSRTPSLENALIGELAAAAVDLVSCATGVVIATGFFIPAADPPAAETDGPPGAIRLCRVLQSLDVPVSLIADPVTVSAISAAVAAAGLLDVPVICMPTVNTTEFAATFWRDCQRRRVSHLISVERVGPAHTPASIAAAVSSDPLLGLRQQIEFLKLVPAANFDRCHNMRGEILDEWTSPIHRLFEQAGKQSTAIRTIGIGDGGNEIGMGRLPWSAIVARLSGPTLAAIPCRIATDYALLAGTSNWGAAALAIATAIASNKPAALDAARQMNAEFEQRLLEQMVLNGPAVDGVTRAATPTVDGLSKEVYTAVVKQMNTVIGK